jgi:hypothetical protein
MVADFRRKINWRRRRQYKKIGVRSQKNSKEFRMEKMLASDKKFLFATRSRFLKNLGLAPGDFRTRPSFIGGCDERRAQTAEIDGLC